MLKYLKGTRRCLLPPILVVMVALGCSTPSQQPAGGPPLGDTHAKQEPQRGGSLRIVGSVTGPGHNDPHLSAAGSGRDFSVPASNYLLRRDVFDENYSVVEDLAKSWDVSPDGLTYTFHLHEGVKYQNLPPVNGREFTSEDAKYNLLRVTGDPSVVPEATRPKLQRKAEFGKINSVETPNKYTVTVKLKEPLASFLDAVAHPGTAMLPKELVDQEQGTIQDLVIGTGPFMLADYKVDQNAVYRRNPEYFKKGLPYLDEVVMLKFSDLQAELSAFRARQIDVSGSGLSPGSLQALQKDIPSIKVLQVPKANMYTVRFNMKFKPFQDVRVRKAIHLAIDRSQYVDVIGEGLGVVPGPVTPLYRDMAGSTDWLMSQPGYRKDKAQDLAEAKRLMQDAGYPDGFTVKTMTIPGRVGDAAILFDDQVKPLNIVTKVEALEYAVFVSRSTQSDFELGFITFTLGTDVDSLLTSHLHSQGARNYGKYSDPVLDDLIEKQRRTVAVEERRRWAQEAEKRILDQAPMLFLLTNVNIQIAQPWVNNLSSGLLIGDTLLSVEKSWLDKH